MENAAAHRRRTVVTGLAVAAGGALVGAVLASTLSASATTANSTAAGAGSGSPVVQENSSTGSRSGAYGGAPAAGVPGPGGFALSLRGTVTAVGTGTVTIKTSAGAVKTYKVTSSSDIDKNGEAQLSSLRAGDAVRYSVVSGTSTIDKLHAGNEAKDRPAFGGPPGAHPGSGWRPGSGARPGSGSAPSPGTTPSSGTSA